MIEMHLDIYALHVRRQYVLLYDYVIGRHINKISLIKVRNIRNGIN